MPNALVKNKIVFFIVKICVNYFKENTRLSNMSKLALTGTKCLDAD